MSERPVVLGDWTQDVGERGFGGYRGDNGPYFVPRDSSDLDTHTQLAMQDRVNVQSAETTCPQALIMQA